MRYICFVHAHYTVNAMLLLSDSVQPVEASSACSYWGKKRACKWCNIKWGLRVTVCPPCCKLSHLPLPPNDDYDDDHTTQSGKNRGTTSGTTRGIRRRGKSRETTSGTTSGTRHRGKSRGTTRSTTRRSRRYGRYYRRYY